MSEEQPPPSFTRELSEQEERDVLLGFMGTVYGETKKLDGNIVGATNTLTRGNSERVKQQVEELVNKPLSQSVSAPMAPQQPPVHQEPQPPVQIPVTPHLVPPTPPENKDQLTFDFDISEKDLLFDKIDKLSSKLDRLHTKIDKLSEIVNKKPVAKKKSVEPSKK